MEALSCYLFIHLNHIPFIRTSLSLIFYFIIQILFLYPDRHGRSSYSSGIWIFPRLQTSFWVLILNSDLLHEIQFPCCVLTCFLLNSRSLPLLSGFSPDDVPGIGTFYDFFRHIWNSEQKHLSVQLRHKKKKTPKRNYKPVLRHFLRAYL